MFLNDLVIKTIGRNKNTTHTGRKINIYDQLE